LIEGVSGAGKTAVCTELQRRGYQAIHGDLENATIRFVKDIDGRGEGLGGLDLIAVNRVRALATATRLGKRAADGTIHVCGMRMNLVEV
jgi:predicted ATPase